MVPGKGLHKYDGKHSWAGTPGPPEKFHTVAAGKLVGHMLPEHTLLPALGSHLLPAGVLSILLMSLLLAALSNGQVGACSRGFTGRPFPWPVTGLQPVRKCEKGPKT